MNQSFKQLKEAFWLVTTQITGFQDSQVRHSYSTNGQPANEIDQDLVYINLTRSSDPYDRQINTTLSGLDQDNGTQGFSYTRVFSVNWSFYGPNSQDNAENMAFGILTEPPREFLAKYDIFPIPDISPPFRIPYNFNSQWWEQVDLRVLFNVGTTRTATVPYIKTAQISLHAADFPEQTASF